MRAVVQRTERCRVVVDNQIVGQSEHGLTILLGVSNDDNEDDARYLTEKIVNLRIFPDEAGKMNLSVKDIAGELMVISQFTLYGDCRKGRRPSFDAAAKPEAAKQLYEFFVELCRQEQLIVNTGQFQSEMLVSLDNHGPVTILLDSKRMF